MFWTNQRNHRVRCLEAYVTYSQNNIQTGLSSAKCHIEDLQATMEKLLEYLDLEKEAEFLKPETTKITPRRGK